MKKILNDREKLYVIAAMKNDGIIENGKTQHTLDEIYESFKDDKMWRVKKYDNWCVRFYERFVYETRKQAKRNFIFKVAKYFTHCTSQILRSNIIIYGGFARSAMLALYQCKRAIYTVLLCWKYYKFHRDIGKIICKMMLGTWFHDMSWFVDSVKDIGKTLKFFSLKKKINNLR